MVTINQETCIGCGACVADCIRDNLEIREGKAMVKDECFRCGHCVAVCPTASAAIPEYDMADVETYDPQSFRLDPQVYLRAVKFRRSMRRFQNRPVSPDKLARILQVGRYTATAVNYQDCRFIVVQEHLAFFKQLVWAGWARFVQVLNEKNDPSAAAFAGYLQAYEQDPVNDQLFLNAPVALIVAADIPLDGGLAAANLENMAIAEGLGVLYDGYVIRGIDANPQAREWLGLEKKTAVTCLLMGYPAVSYHRTAPRRPVDAKWL